MTARRLNLLALLCAGSLCAPRLPAESPQQTEWRSRVRQETAALAAPPGPPGAAQRNPIDAFLADWYSGHGIERPARCDDTAFVRRVHLDLVGLLPDAQTTEEFLADAAADKRSKLVDRLLADKQAYAEHWITFWNDLLRNDEQDHILVTRHAITKWLLQALIHNEPYDQFVGELINPGEQGPTGFIQGVEWEFSNTASDIPPMQVAQVSAQVFQGVNLKCSSCHDHFSHAWKLNDAWNFASFFADGPLEPQRCDKPTGQRATPQFLFAGLGQVEPQTPRRERLQQLSLMITRPKNPRFAKVIVNRLFKKLIGQGLIERVDDLDDRQPFKPELLEWLAYDFMSHDYDVKQLLRQIATSDTYQLVPVDAGRPNEDGDGEPLFVGPRLRRMSSEQFLDAVSAVTGYWPKSATMKVEVDNPRIRAWRHREPSRLATVIGRPNRDVVQSERLDIATMLQALELVNGKVLADYVQAGAKEILGSELGKSGDAAKVVDQLCLRAYSRHARPEEAELAGEMLGPAGADAAARQQGLEDLLWILVVSPEFQYLH